MTIIFKKTTKMLSEVLPKSGFANISAPAGLADGRELEDLLESSDYYEHHCHFENVTDEIQFKGTHDHYLGVADISIKEDVIIDKFYAECHKTRKDGPYPGWRYKTLYLCEVSACFVLVLSEEQPEQFSVNLVHEVFERFDVCILIYPN